MGLAQAAADRAQGGGLPTFGTGPYADQLVRGRDAARAVILRYRPNFAFDATASRSALDQVDAWAQRNAAALEQEFKAGTEQLTQTVQLQMGRDAAQAFVLALYTEAARGVGAWASGAVARAVAGQLPGAQAGDAWARQDAEHRLTVFGTIVKMDQDGTLASVFDAGAGASGLGAAWFVWVIIGVAAVIAAAIVVYALGATMLRRNNDRLDDMCGKAQAAGDTATTQACIRYSAELQKTALDPLGLKGGVDTLVQGALLLGALYVGVRYGVPALQQALERRRAASGASALLEGSPA